jgi:ribosome-associated protein
MIHVTDEITIDDSEIQLEFVRSSGPGGQNVNKVSTAELRFNVFESPSLTPDVRQRLIKLDGSKITADGILIIHARRFRSQEQNRNDAVQRLVELIRKAAVKPKPRRKTKPSPASRQRRLNAKRKRSEIKRHRKSAEYLDD